MVEKVGWLGAVESLSADWERERRRGEVEERGEEVGRRGGKRER